MKSKEVNKIIDEWFEGLSTFRSSGTRIVRYSDLRNLQNMIYDKEKDSK